MKPLAYALLPHLPPHHQVPHPLAHQEAHPHPVQLADHPAQQVAHPPAPLVDHLAAQMTQVTACRFNKTLHQALERRLDHQAALEEPQPQPQRAQEPALQLVKIR